MSEIAKPKAYHVHENFILYSLTNYQCIAKQGRLSLVRPVETKL